MTVRLSTVDEINDLCLWRGMFTSPEAKRAAIERRIALHLRRDVELQAELRRQRTHPEPPI